MKVLDNPVAKTHYKVGMILKYRTCLPFTVVGFKECTFSARMKSSLYKDLCRHCSGYQIIPDQKDAVNEVWHDVEGDFTILVDGDHTVITERR